MKPEEAACEGLFWLSSIRWKFPASAMHTFCALRSTRSASIAGRRTGRHGFSAAAAKRRCACWRWTRSFLNRPVNEGFSGGEKKRNEIVQMAVLEPKLAVLDETDSGLDIDALKIVAKGVNAMRNPKPRHGPGDALSALA